MYGKLYPEKDIFNAMGVVYGRMARIRVAQSLKEVAILKLVYWLGPQDILNCNNVIFMRFRIFGIPKN